MQKEHLPIYQIQDFEAILRKDKYFYFSSFAAHLQEHRFIREPHKHDFYIVLFITQGGGTHTIDFREYAVQPGAVFFMTPGQVHSWQLTDDADGYVVFFTREFYAREYPDRLLVNYPFFNLLFYNPVLQLTTESETIVAPLLHHLREEYKHNHPMRDVLLSRYLDILLIELTRLYKPGNLTSPTIAKDLTLLQNLERLIDQHYREHKPVAFYADRLHVTAKHLNEVCRNAVGKTTKDLIQHRILLEAQRLLSHADLTSSQIAISLGFFDNTYFFRFFKKHTGSTPEQFRTMHR